MLVHHFLERSAERLPKKTALVFEEKRWTYADLDARANQLAHALVAAGVQTGARVVVWLDNSVEMVLAIFAVFKAGGVLVPVNPQVKPSKLAFIVRDCEAAVLVTSDDRVPSTDIGAKVIAITEGEWPFEKFAATKPEERVGEQSLAALIYTSGSTGTPRGVMLTHANMDAAAGSIIEYLGNVEDDVVFDLLPLSFDYGLYNMLMPFRFGGRVVLERKFVAPHQIVAAIQRERVTGLPLVPTLVAGLVKLRGLQGCDFGSMRYVTSSGQALPPAHLELLRAMFPTARVFSMYGLTECKRVAYLPPEELDRRPTSVGKAMPRTEAWVVDENGARAAAGQIGELVVRGPHVMQGYWNRPDETARALRKDENGQPLLYTGDLFRTDEEGFLYFVARRDDLIKTSGMRVSPREIEMSICDIDGVAEAAAFGVPDEILGQAIHVVVTPRDGSSITPDAVIDHCLRTLERHMVPRHVEIRAELPLTVTGKISRRSLAAEM